MENKMISLIFVLTCATVIIFGNTMFQERKTSTNLNIGTGNSAEHNKVKNFFDKNQDKNQNQNLQPSVNCKTCHYLQYPTKNDPGLNPCPRQGMISVYHKPSEAPEVLLLNEVSNRYEPVIFSHKLHAQMSEMGESCNGCHHYNTTGPILPCKECHEQSRKREDVSKPDLRAAYHRQCMNCHRQWNHTTGCNNTCHFPKDEKTKAKIESELVKIKGINHPAIETPIKLKYETGYEKGKIVTFYHDEHINKFKIECVACHQQNNCIKCHDKEHLFKNDDPEFVKPIKVKKTLSEHHKPCFGCHAGENNQANCSKCHKGNESKPFEHTQSTGWALNRYHVTLTCQKCHGNSTPYKSLNNDCMSCHPYFKKGSFDHKVTGFIPSESHQDADCDNCHLKNDFSAKPSCKGCHDDKSYPQNIPGKMIFSKTMRKTK